MQNNFKWPIPCFTVIELLVPCSQFFFRFSFACWVIVSSQSLRSRVYWYVLLSTILRIEIELRITLMYSSLKAKTQYLNSCCTFMYANNTAQSILGFLWEKKHSKMFSPYHQYVQLTGYNWMIRCCFPLFKRYGTRSVSILGRAMAYRTKSHNLQEFKIARSDWSQISWTRWQR